jgi:hypothetical protein
VLKFKDMAGRRIVGEDRDPRSRTLSWRPGPITWFGIGLNLVVAGWLFSPELSGHQGVDSHVFHAVGRAAAEGKNPYDPNQLFAVEDRLYNQPNGLRPGDEGYVYKHTYPYPPFFTAALEVASRVPWPVFFWAGVALALGTSMLAFELLLGVLQWRGRMVVRVAFLFSAPVAVEAFFGNSSALLLLAWAAGLWLMNRSRRWLAGAVLAFCWIKPTVGLVVVGALLLFGPGNRSQAFFGFVLGSLALLVVDLAVTGVGPLLLWGQIMLGYGTALTGGSPGAAFSGNITSLAGASALLMVPLGHVLAVGVSGLLMLVVAAWLLLDRRRPSPLEPETALAVAMAAAVTLSPYLHFNDLVLAAYPLLVIASRPLTILSRVAIGIWALLFPARLALMDVASTLAHAPSLDPSWWNLQTAFGEPAGIGSWISLLVLVGVAALAVSRLLGRGSMAPPASGSPRPHHGTALTGPTSL